MKHVYFFAIAVFFIQRSYAQAPFNTMDSLDINNIIPLTLVHGDMWWDPATQLAACQFPGHSHKNINFAGAIWMSGYDAGGQLHIAAQTYRQSGNDYWPGPLGNSDTLTYATSATWAKIWKVKQSDIQYFQALSAHTTTNTPNAILTWPGKGNTNAEGAGGAALTITTDMAPFVDLNGNGIYEPLLGEYPDIKGDEALWWVFSDNGPAHTSTNGKSIGVEVHAMAYEYKRGTLIDDVVYYDYTLFNKSHNNYSDFRLGQWDDMDLGYYYDDFIGFDSTWRMGITYNGTNCDGCSAGNPPGSYGYDPPQAGITMVVLPGDAGSTYVPAGSFVSYNNDNSAFGNPFTDTQFNNYLRAMYPNGRSLIDSVFSFGGRGFAPPDTNYIYNGDPSDTSGWSECSSNNNPGDRRFIISSNNFPFNAGTSQHLVIALVVADSAGGCPMTSFNKIAIVADTAWANYYNPPPVLPSGIATVSSNDAIELYPDPAHDKLFIETGAQTTSTATITIFNALGQRVNVPYSASPNGLEADVSLLPPALYYVVYKSGNGQYAAKFLKE